MPRSVESTVLAAHPGSHQRVRRSGSSGAGGARRTDDPALGRAAGASRIAGGRIMKVSS
jgi:hypothetical protein